MNTIKASITIAAVPSYSRFFLMSLYELLRPYCEQNMTRKAVIVT